MGAPLLSCADQSLLRMHEFGICIRWTTVSMGRRSIYWRILTDQDLVMLLSTCLFRVPSKLSLTLQSKSSLLADLRQQQEEVSSLKLSHAEDAAALTVMQGQISQAHVRKTQSGWCHQRSGC